VFDALWTGEGSDVDAVIEAKGLKQMNDTGALDRSSTTSSPPTPNVEQFRGRQGEGVQRPGGPGHEGDQGQGQPAQVNELLKAGGWAEIDQRIPGPSRRQVQLVQLLLLLRSWHGPQSGFEQVGQLGNGADTACPSWSRTYCTALWSTSTAVLGRLLLPVQRDGHGVRGGAGGLDQRRSIRARRCRPTSRRR
jgi:hypothetical protein